MTNSPKYPLLPFSQLVYDITRWKSGLYMNSMEILAKGEGKNIDRWREAIRTALLNHPVFSTQIDWCGRQYFVKNRNIFIGKYHQIDFFTKGDDLIINGRISRILGDGKSLAILMDDILRAYHGETLPKDDYIGYLENIEQLKQSEHYCISRENLINEFSDESIPVRPTLDKNLWTLHSPRQGVYESDYTILHREIIQFAKSQTLSMDGFFSLCAALAIAEYNGTNAAALTWAYEGRERYEEQRIFGSLHRDIPFQIKNLQFPISNLKSDLISEARNQIRTGIAHSDYPYTLTAPYNKRWNYAVNVLRVEDEHELVKLLPQQVELLPSPSQKYAYALLDIEIHESFEGLNIIYRYSATHYKESSIQRYAALVKKHVLWLLSD